MNSFWKTKGNYYSFLNSYGPDVLSKMFKPNDNTISLINLNSEKVSYVIKAVIRIQVSLIKIQLFLKKKIDPKIPFKSGLKKRFDLIWGLSIKTNMLLLPLLKLYILSLMKLWLRHLIWLVNQKRNRNARHLSKRKKSKKTKKN